MTAETDMVDINGSASSPRCDMIRCDACVKRLVALLALCVALVSAFKVRILMPTTRCPHFSRQSGVIANRPREVASRNYEV